MLGLIAIAVGAGIIVSVIWFLFEFDHWLYGRTKMSLGDWLGLLTLIIAGIIAATFLGCYILK